MFDPTSFFTELASEPGASPTKVLAGLMILLFSYVGLSIISFILFHIAERIVGRTNKRLDGEMVLALRTPAQYFVILMSLFLFIEYLFPNLTLLDYPTQSIFKVSLVVLGAFTLNKIINVLLWWYSGAFANEESILPIATINWSPETQLRWRTGLNEGVLPIISKTVSIVIFSSALIMALYQVGIEVAPLLAGLGIAGLAVALALQDSLSNFFAGVYVLADKPIRIGDYIKLEDGSEGHVQEIGWRSIRLKTLFNNTIVIPNNKLAASVITNYSLPKKDVWTSVVVGVHYKSDPEVVERILKKVAAKMVKKDIGILAGVGPIIRFSDFGESALVFKLIVPIQEYTAQWVVAHNLRKEIHKQFKANGIEIPFPIRTIYMEKS